MNDTQALQIRPARPVSLAPDALEQCRRYLADAELRAQLADAIEAEATALKQISDNQALWILAASDDYRVECRLNVLTRQLVVTVKLPGAEIAVMDDRDPMNLVYNRPDTARWPETIIHQHEEAKALRDVLASQREMAENAQAIKRQSAI